MPNESLKMPNESQKTSNESLKMPEVPFGPHTISRLIAGGNQQVGATHQSRLMTMHMLEYYTLDRIVSFLQYTRTGERYL